MSGVVRTTAVALRTCKSCAREQQAEMFGMYRDASGKHARRTVCIACVVAVDESITSGTPAWKIVGDLHVSEGLVRERMLVLRVRFPAVATRECVSCRQIGVESEFPVSASSGARRRVCQKCLARLDELLSRGVQPGAISEQTGLSKGAVAARRKELGLRGPRERMSQELITKILNLATETTDHTVIAKTVGDDPARVRRILLRHGVVEPDHSRRPVPSETLQRGLWLLQDGASYAEVARTLGVDQVTLSRHFPGFGRDAEHRALIAWINRNPALKALHEEIMSVDLAA